MRSSSQLVGTSRICDVLRLEEAMPKVKRSKKKPPEGWELIEPTLDELEQKMREGERSLSACCSVNT